MKSLIDLKTAAMYASLTCAIAASPVLAFGGGDDDHGDHHGHAGDVYIYVEEGHIETGLVDEDEAEEHVRVFEAEFGESGLPEYTDEPGWEAFSGTFDPQLRVGWNAVHGLERWNGDGFDGSLDETIIVNFSTLSFEIGSEPVDGFDLAVASDGSFHRHIGFLMDHPKGNPAEGIYLVELELFAADLKGGSAPEHSEPFWIVFNYGGSEEDHEAAVEWVAENLAEEDHGHHDECHADFDADGHVDVLDLLILIGDWGTCSGCATDLDENGTVNVADLLDLMADWGECPHDDHDGDHDDDHDGDHDDDHDGDQDDDHDDDHDDDGEG